MQGGLHIRIASERLGTFLGLPINNALITAWAVIVLLMVCAYFIGRRPQLIPGKVQAAFEWLFEFVIDYMQQMLGSRALALRYFPLVMTIFLFVFFANELEFFPLIGSIGFYQNGELVPLLRPATTDLNLTLALAIISFFVVELSGIFILGFFRYGSKFLNFKGGAIGFVVGVLEFIGNVARLISFSFRLFGNIFAGDILVAVAAAFLPYFLPVPVMLFESFVGLLQAAIFALLTLAFIKLAIEEPHAGEAHAPAH